jgi:hypothetical protein
MTSSKKRTAADRGQPNRQQLIAKLQKALKSAYKPVAANTGRSVLEQVLFACCLENAHHAAAEKAFEALMKGYFDLNEVRVTTVADLCLFARPRQEAFARPRHQDPGKSSWYPPLRRLLHCLDDPGRPCHSA